MQEKHRQLALTALALAIVAVLPLSSTAVAQDRTTLVSRIIYCDIWNSPLRCQAIAGAVFEYSRRGSSKIMRAYADEAGFLRLRLTPGRYNFKLISVSGDSETGLPGKRYCLSGSGNGCRYYEFAALNHHPSNSESFVVETIAVGRSKDSQLTTFAYYERNPV